MENMLVPIGSIIYAAWAYYSGWKWINGRFAFLEQEGKIYIILKAVIGFCVGCIIGAFYFIYWILRLVFHWAK